VTGDEEGGASGAGLAIAEPGDPGDPVLGVSGTAACGAIRFCAEAAAGTQQSSAATSSRQRRNDVKPRRDMPFLSGLIAAI
jgi:hypothetical protein